MVHLTVLTLLLQLGHLSFPTSQAIATVCTMTFNFAVNNVLTYRDQRLRGVRWLRGCGDEKAHLDSLAGVSA